MTTFGKYLGGGMSFGAFGGRAEIMGRFDPSRPDAFAHSGTYNNNVLTMAAGVAGLSKVFTPEAADALSATGERFKARLNRIGERHGVPVQVTGVGSILCMHFQQRSRSDSPTTRRIPRPRRGRCSTSRCWRAASTSRGAASSRSRCR